MTGPIEELTPLRSRARIAAPPDDRRLRPTASHRWTRANTSTWKARDPGAKPAPFRVAVVDHGKKRVQLLELAQRLGNVSLACRMTGYSRQSFYRLRALYERGGEVALSSLGPGRSVARSRLAAEVQEAVLEMARVHPTWGKARVARELALLGVRISPAGVRGVWHRHRLTTSIDRLAAQGASVQGTIGAGRAERQTSLPASSGPGQCGAQDTLEVGMRAGSRLVYQQTFVDIYSGVALCRVYGEKSDAVAADFLTNRVVPFYRSHGIMLARVFTDRGREFGARGQRHHAYQLHLDLHGIEHQRSVEPAPHRNEVCHKFHRLMLAGFYRRAPTWERISELQIEIDRWLDRYNRERPRPGASSTRSRMEIFLEGLDLQ